MSIQIRPATTADREPLFALSRRTIRDCYSCFLGEETVAAYLASGAVEQYVSEHIQRCLVIVREAQVAGYTVAKHNLIDLMMIDSHYHRRGLGTRLLRYVERQLFDTFDELKLESFRQNANANAFYCCHDWIAVRTFADDESGQQKILFHKTKPG